MNEPSNDQLPILQRLPSQQVIACLEDGYKAFVRLPLYNTDDEDNRPRYLRLDSANYTPIIEMLQQDTDNCETHFYFDFDRDLILDPTAEL